MNRDKTAEAATDRRTLAWFFGLTFGLTWGLGMLFVFFSEPLTRVFGEVGYANPLFILAVYSPGIAGVVLVARRYGWRGLGRFFRRLTLWRMPAAWWALLVLGVPGAFYLGAALNGNLGGPFPFAPWYGVIPALAMALVLGPIEEFGWRGVALPLLQRRLAPLWASLVVGLVWGVWHLPAFLLSGTPQSGWSFAPYLLGVVALSVVVTPMFNASRGSLLIPALFHFQANGPVWPDAQPYDMFIFIAMAVIVVVLNRRQLLDKGAAATDLLAPEGATTARPGSAPRVRPDDRLTIRT